jgi:hypothetical protein
MEAMPFLHAYIEDPAHAMFVCKNPELVPIRSVFLESIEKIIPGIVNQFPDALQTFKGFLVRRGITPLLGRLAFDVSKIFDVSPMLLVNDPAVET